jgi:hypothetical protein
MVKLGSGSGSASNKNQNPDPHRDPHHGDKWNPDLHQCDGDPPQCDADPQHWTMVPASFIFNLYI